MYSRYPADIHYGEQDRQGYSSYAPTSVSPYYRYPYSYVPVAATHGYGNVNHATATPYIYSREHPDPHYGEQDRQGYSSYALTYVSPYYRYPYSYVPVAATHGYGNVNHATPTPNACQDSRSIVEVYLLNLTFFPIHF